MLENNNKYNLTGKSLLAVQTLTVYRKLREDSVINCLLTLLKSIRMDNADLSLFLDSYSSFIHTFFTESDHSLKEYIIELVLSDENPFSLGIGKRLQSDVSGSIRAAAALDLDRLSLISEISSAEIKAAASSVFSCTEGIEEIIGELPNWDLDNSPSRGFEANDCEFQLKKEMINSNKWSGLINELESFHIMFGTGRFYRFRAFYWESDDKAGFFKGIASPDPVRFSNLIGYEEQRQDVIDNTLQFLKGYNANNMLLYGDRGTGKSSTVKALLNEYWQQGLRIIEVPKNRLVDFSKISNLIRDRAQKFIIFVDDLAFEDNEENYTALKAVLEGSIEKKPDNVLIYATSNRRHLIKEKFSDRAGLQYGTQDDEVRAMDSIQEKLSLADRFGMTVVFSSPDKKSYLKIVEGLAVQRGINIDIETLHKEALKWELWYNGRSPRTARQFIDWLEGEKGQQG